MTRKRISVLCENYLAQLLLLRKFTGQKKKKQIAVNTFRVVLCTVLSISVCSALSDATYRGCLYKAVMRFMTSPNAPTAMAFVNEIHTITTFMRPLKRVAAQVGLYEGLGSNPL